MPTLYSGASSTPFELRYSASKQSHTPTIAIGTRGFQIIKFKGRYWIFYNHWDSFPDGLGNSLVESIPENPEKYQKWLQSQRNFFTKWDSLLQEFLAIQPDDLRQLHSDRPHMPVFHAAFDGRLQEDAPPVINTGLITSSSNGPTPLTSTEKSSLLITVPTSAWITFPGTVSGLERSSLTARGVDNYCHILFLHKLWLYWP